MRIVLLVSGIFLCLNNLFAQVFYFGNDLSYVNQMEDCGAVFKEDMVPKDVFQIFADHGSNLVRARLWVDPSWWQDSIDQPAGVKPHYNDLDDVKKTLQRARAAGMQVMLGIHYSDFWADPGRQLVPRDWQGVAYDIDKLSDSVYNYTYRVLAELDNEGLMPEFVKIGNENNGGILKHIKPENGWDPIETVSDSWSRHAQLFNAGIQAVRDMGSIASIDPKIVLHFAGLSGAIWNYNNIINNGVTDFDIMGISYYYAWHGGNIAQLESTLSEMKSSFPAYEVMVAETGYIWSTLNFDGLGNIIKDPDPQYLPVIPEKQLEYMTDYTRAVMRAGGIGVIFWEPAWVSTPCRTPWGMGSSHDHVVFFDPVNTNFMENGGGRWGESRYYQDPDDLKLSFKVEMTGQDVSKGVYIAGSWSADTGKIIPMADEGNGIYSYYTYVPEGDTGYFFFLNDTLWSAREQVPAECASYADTARSYAIQSTNKTYSYKWSSCEPAVPPDQPDVTFNVSMKGSGMDLSGGVYLVGDVTEWEFIQMAGLGDSLYSVTLEDINEGSPVAYYFITTNSWDNYEEYRETVPEECAYSDEVTGNPNWTVDRGFFMPAVDTIIGYVWGSCTELDPSVGIDRTSGKPGNEVRIYPNPASGDLYISWKEPPDIYTVGLYDLTGKEALSKKVYSGQTLVRLDIRGLRDGLYIMKLHGKNIAESGKLMIRNH